MAWQKPLHDTHCESFSDGELRQALPISAVEFRAAASVQRVGEFMDHRPAWDTSFYRDRSSGQAVPDA